MTVDREAPPTPAGAPPALAANSTVRRRSGTLAGVALAAVSGLTVLLFLHLTKDSKLQTGITPAHASCSQGELDCLPALNYVDTSGGAYPPERLAEQVVLVNFWATWCRPCEAEIPDLSRVYDKYKGKGVVFLGVLTDNPDDQKLLNFQSDHEMTYPVVRASREIMEAYNSPNAYPMTLIYDRHGKLAYQHLGALREAQLEAQLGPLVGKN